MMTSPHGKRKRNRGGVINNRDSLFLWCAAPSVACAADSKSITSLESPPVRRFRLVPCKCALRRISPGRRRMLPRPSVVAVVFVIWLNKDDTRKEGINKCGEQGGVKGRGRKQVYNTIIVALSHIHSYPWLPTSPFLSSSLSSSSFKPQSTNLSPCMSFTSVSPVSPPILPCKLNSLWPCRLSTSLLAGFRSQWQRLVLHRNCAIRPGM